MHVFIQLLFQTWCYIALFDVLNIFTSIGHVYQPRVCMPVLLSCQHVLCDLPVVFHVGQMHTFYCSIIFYHRKIEQLIYFCIDGAVDWIIAIMNIITFHVRGLCIFQFY